MVQHTDNNLQVLSYNNKKNIGLYSYILVPLQIQSDTQKSASHTLFSC